MSGAILAIERAEHDPAQPGKPRHLVEQPDLELLALLVLGELVLELADIGKLDFFHSGSMMALSREARRASRLQLLVGCYDPQRRDKE